MKNIPAFELKKVQSEFPSVKITSSQVAADFIRQFYSDDIEIYESCFILMLNGAQKTMGYAKISQGGVAGTVVDVKIVCKYAVESLASGVILAHNHPSGSLLPSGPDTAITQRLKGILKVMDSTLIDHIILTKEGFYSFADDGEL
jgi:DNA repair protein RadC